MKTLPAVITIALTLHASPGLLRAQDADTPVYRPINPALLYWQAAALLAPTNDRQAAELNKMATGETPAAPAKIERFYLGTARKFMRAAALSPAPCDWGLPYEEGPAANVPHIAKLQEMADLAVAEAESSFAADRPAEGCASLLIAHRMARHAGADGTLVGLSLQYGIDDAALRAAARHSLAWDEPARRTYAAQLRELPPLRPLAEVFRRDYEILADWLERVSRLDGPARQKAMLAAFPQPAGVSLASPDLAKWDAPTWQREIDAFRAQPARVIGSLGPPWQECHEALAAFERDSRQSPFYFNREIGALPSFITVRAFTNATLRTMLDAALRDGDTLDEAKAAGLHDSFEEEPLRLRKGGDGVLVLTAAQPHPAGKTIELKLGK